VRRLLEDKRIEAELEEIPDTEHELVLERVCAIDVAKDSGTVCVRVSGRVDRRVSKVWDVPARRGAVAELAEHLLAEGIEKVTVEATSVLRAGGGRAVGAAGQRP
jgi:transposase